MVGDFGNAVLIAKIYVIKGLASACLLFGRAKTRIQHIATHVFLSCRYVVKIHHINAQLWVRDSKRLSHKDSGRGNWAHWTSGSPGEPGAGAAST